MPKEENEALKEEEEEELRGKGGVGLRWNDSSIDYRIAYGSRHTRMIHQSRHTTQGLNRSRFPSSISFSK